MASSWFLLIIMPFKFLHHVAWPLLALLYPMCASVQAIETDSYEETKHLISYWILLSLIYLFDYAFMSLLPWFRLWMYIKLILIFWLTMPDFGRASYVYNNLIHAMKLQIVTWRLNNYWRKWFFDKDDFLREAERYMNEYGTEALEKLIASKKTMCRPDAEVTNEIIVTNNKEMLKTNGERLQIEQHGIKNLEAIEKQEIVVTKQNIPVMPITGPSPNASSATVETKGASDSGRAGGEIPHSSASTVKEVQKEWTCALCLVTALSEQVWNAHLNGKKHRASIQKQKDAEVTNEIIATGNKEILKTNEGKLQTEHKDIKDFEAVEKKEIHETKQDIPDMPKIEPSQNASSATVETKVTEESDRAGGEVPRSSTSSHNEVQREWTCALCLLTVTCEETLNIHLNGKKHRAALMKQRDAEVTNKIIATDNKKILKTNGERLQSEHKDSEAVEKKEIPSSKQDIPVMPITGPSPNASSAKVETKGRAESSPNASSATVETKGTAESDTVGREVPRSSTSTLNEVQKEWTCAMCLVTTTSEKDLNSHINGRRHRDALEAAVLKAKKQPASQEVPRSSTSTLKEVQKQWTCAMCLVTTTSEKDLNSHINGRRHRDALEAAVLKEKKQPAQQKLQIYLPKGIRPSPSTQAVRGPTPFGSPMPSPIGGVPFPYHSGATPFRGPTPSPISVPFPYYRQPEFSYYIPTPSLPYQDPNRR